jgi:myo-inositol 2-dehydrogenase / D-chiro-inositol 1-dehydrogenase
MSGDPGRAELRVALVGVGVMGTDHAYRLRERISGARLVAVSDSATDRAQELADRLSGVAAVADPLELIASPDVDAVVLASPGFAHEEQVLACLEHGKPVLCEKPLTMDAASSYRLVEAEAKGGRALVQVGFMRRFDPEYAELKALLDSGELGRTLLLHHVHRNKTVPGQFRSEMIVRDSLVHEVDVSRWLFDSEIEEVTVLAPTPTSLVEEGVLDPQVALFRMSGGGLATTEVFVHSQVGYEVRCEAVAERGNATIGLGQGVLVRRDNRYGGAIPDDFRLRFARAYDLEVQGWVDATRRGTVVGPTAWDGYAASAVCEAGLESLATGRPVRVALAEQPQLQQDISHRTEG